MGICVLGTNASLVLTVCSGPVHYVVSADIRSDVADRAATGVPNIDELGLLERPVGNLNGNPLRLAATVSPVVMAPGGTSHCRLSRDALRVVAALMADEAFSDRFAAVVDVPLP